MKSKTIWMWITLILIIFSNASANKYTYSACGSSSSLNSANLGCTTCPSNSIANTYQTIATSCQCSAGSLPSGNGVCSPASNITCGSSTNSFYPFYSISGDMVNTSSGTLNCAPCINAFTNINATKCTPCGTGMVYNVTSSRCECNGSAIRSQLGCFVASTNPAATGTYTEQLKYLIPGCGVYKDYLSCSYLSNLCAFSKGAMTLPQCSFFSANSKTNMLYANSSGFSLTFNPKATIKMKLVSFLPTGNYLSEQEFVLSDLMRCGTPSDATAAIIIGTNIQKTCSFDTSYLMLKLTGKKWKGKVYQLLIQGDDGFYYDVSVYMPGSYQAIKRFFTEDIYTDPTKITILTGFTISFTFNSNKKLDNPKIHPTYDVIARSDQGSLITMSYKVVFNADIASFWVGALAAFITVSVIALIHSIIKTYIGYLNKKSALQFIMNFIGVYSIWLYYYLLIMTGYWFLFTKTTTDPIIILPSQDSTLYGAFYALVGIMVAFRLFWVISDKMEKLSTEVFVINWERGEFRNSWREIFIINSLAEFYTHRTFSIFWMFAVMMFFTNGVGWQKLAVESASTSVVYQSITPKNRIYLYFLGCAVLLAVGLIFKVLRRLSVLFWPYPFEDFADYCTVANISLYFVKRRSPHAYYLHASIPDRTEVGYRQINESIRRGLQKNRSISNQLSALDSLKMYVIYLSKQMEDRHTQLLKVLEEQQHSKRVKFGKSSKKKLIKNPRQQFIENRLKPHLEGINTQQNNRRLKSLLQNLCGLPPIDLREGRQRGVSKIYFDEQLQLVNEVFPNGNQFEEIHTIMVIFLGCLTLVNSCPIAAFLTYFIDQYVFKWWIQYSCRNNLEQMTKVKKGFML